MQASCQLIMLGAASSRPGSNFGIAGFVRRTGIPFFNTPMGKGTVPDDSHLYMGTAAFSERDYVHDVVEKADLIIFIGHDTVEKPPFIMRPKGPKVIHQDVSRQYGFARQRAGHDGRRPAVGDFPDFGLTFNNPDFVTYAESYGAKGTRVEAGGVHVVAVPVDYSENIRGLIEELRSRKSEPASA